MIGGTGDIIAALLLSLTVGNTVAIFVAELTEGHEPSAWTAFLLAGGIVGWRFLAALGWW